MSRMYESNARQNRCVFKCAQETSRRRCYMTVVSNRLYVTGPNAPAQQPSRVNLLTHMPKLSKQLYRTPYKNRTPAQSMMLSSRFRLRANSSLCVSQILGSSSQQGAQL
jgi:hypothetical protein